MSLELRSLLPYPNSCLGTSPHQQEGDTKMQSVCGIDVSKDRLDIMVLPEQQVGPNWSRGCAASRSRRSVLKRAEVTNAARCEPCWQPECRHVRSTRSSCGSSRGPVGFWPRTIRSTLV